MPDAYKLHIAFESCFENNMNTSVFQYYVKMIGYDGYESAGQPGTVSNDDILSRIADSPAMKSVAEKVG